MSLDRYSAYRHGDNVFVAPDYSAAVGRSIVACSEQKELIAFKRSAFFGYVVVERYNIVLHLHIRDRDSARRIDRFDAVDGWISVLGEVFEFDFKAV